MNTASLSVLGAKAKPLAEGIARWCEQEGIGVEFGRRGKHPFAELTFNRQTRKFFFSGTPSDWRTSENQIRDIKTTVRAMGWTPKKEVEMETAMEPTVLKSFADLPKMEEPQPHRVEIRLPKPEPVNPNQPPKPEEGVAARNEWAYGQKQKGRTIENIYRDLKQAGWDVKAPNIVYSMCQQHRRALDDGPMIAKPARPEPERLQITAEPAIDPLILAIAEAIAPLIREQLAKQGKALEAMRAKADKWDAISGLVREA